MSMGFNYTTDNSNNGGTFLRLQRQQVGLLSRVFMLTSFLFVVSAAIMFGMVKYTQAYWARGDSFTLGAPLLAFFLLIVSNILFYFMQKNLQRSFVANASYLFFFTLLLSIAFGTLLSIANAYLRGLLLERLPLIFLITGISALLMGVFGKIMPDRMAAGISRFILVGIMAMLFFALLISVICFFVLPSTLGYLNFAYALLGSILVMSTIALTVNQLRKSEEFISFDGQSSALARSLVMVYSASLLNSLLTLVWWLVQIFIFTRRD